MQVFLSADPPHLSQARPDTADELATGRYVRSRGEEMLEVAQRLVKETDPFTAFGLPASPVMLKAVASAAGSVLVAFVSAAYNSNAKGLVVGGAASGGGSLAAG